MKETPQNRGPGSGYAGWNQPKPEIIPEPTIWPASLALAVTLSLWGLASSLLISAIGLCLFIIAMAGWIGDIRHERKTH